jgi:hypothetical protein
MKYRYEAQGMGSFPTDMLRYDRAKVVSHYRPSDTERMVYVIEGEVKPTVGRWNSFLWQVRNVKPVVED